MSEVMDADRMSRALTRIAHEILERNRGARTSWRWSASARAASRSPGGWRAR
jgi:pyrimidine operon attenuation protein/uracil phosphoribosyltransferase